MMTMQCPNPHTTLISICTAPVCRHVNNRALLDLPRGLVSEVHLIIMKTTHGDARQRARIHGLDVIRKLQMLHAAVGRDDALLDVVAPHLSVNKLPQKMWVHNRKFWGHDERTASRTIRSTHLRP